jgi:hypothetical protein
MVVPHTFRLSHRHLRIPLLETKHAKPRVFFCAASTVKSADVEGPDGPVECVLGDADRILFQRLHLLHLLRLRRRCPPKPLSLSLSGLTHVVSLWPFDVDPLNSEMEYRRRNCPRGQRRRLAAASSSRSRCSCPEIAHCEPRIAHSRQNVVCAISFIHPSRVTAQCRTSRGMPPPVTANINTQREREAISSESQMLTREPFVARRPCSI